MSREAAGEPVLASPFKFGFYAGLGFFCASAMMSVLSVVLVAAIGIGSVASLIIGSAPHANAAAPRVTAAEPADAATDATTAAAVIPPRWSNPPTYHRKPRTTGSD